MSIQFSELVRNARLDQVESTIGTAPTLQLWSGSLPASCGASDAVDGDLLCSIVLPSDWLDVASSGSKANLASWSGVGTSEAGLGVTITHFRLKQGATCHVQGLVGISSGDLQLDNTSIAEGQTVVISSFVLTDGNA